ncbi:MAG TPA: VOC family protein [Steroidobacteraceae bacterium]|nr:VOC family protein [Steroidobacteraceae bacterium]
MPALNQLNIICRDFEATLAFYRRLGLAIADRPAHDGIRHAEVTLPSGLTLEFDDLALAETYNAAWRGTGGSSSALIGFALASREEVDRLYAELTAAGYAPRQPPYDAFWGARYAIVADPNGNDVGLMSPVDAARRSWPPAASPGP